MPLTNEQGVYRTPAGRRAVVEWCTAQLDGWPVVHERRRVPTSAGETHLTTAGTGSGTVVLLPGTNANAATYLPLAAALAQRGPVVIADLPGQPGLSADARPRRHRLQWYGRWLADVLEQIGSPQAVVLGHSLGGAIALACDSPRIAARVLVSTGGLTRLQVGPALLAATMSWSARPTRARSAALLRHFVAPGHTVPSTLVDWYTLVARHCRSSLAPPALPAETLRRCGAVPCLVATGEHDVFLPPRRLRPAAQRHLAAPLNVIAAAGHLVTDEHPHRIAALLDEISPSPR